MELAPSGVPLSFEVTFDISGLDVGMSVYDTTGVTPVLVQGPTLMAHIVNATYAGSFTATAGHSYVIVKSVYTDGTLTVLNPNYSTGSESIYAESLPTTTTPSCGGIVGFVTCCSAVPQLPQLNVFEIFLGDTKTISLRVVQSLGGNPLDLTSVQDISIALPNADGSFTDLLLSMSQVTVASPTNWGNFSAVISSANSVLLNVGVLQNLDVTFTFSGAPFTVRYYQALSVFQP